MEGKIIQQVDETWLIMYQEDNIDKTILPTLDVDTSVLYNDCFITFEFTEDGYGAITSHRPLSLI